MKSTILTIAFALVAGLAMAAPDEKKADKPEKGKGKDPAARAEAMMKKLDKDADGKISKEEFAASPMGKKMTEKGGAEAVDKAFGRMDANKDGSLTKDELGKRGGKGKGKPDGKGKPEGDKKKPADS